ncbi:MAG: hypothetical protein QG656_539 [Candidatus Hydrogenedentes bacterium]|nr:hypothetical protein [Candidatus Hydrogenedentota bacterium]
MKIVIVAIPFMGACAVFAEKSAGPAPSISFPTFDALAGGTQKVEVLGATGTECLEFTKELDRRLGVARGERVFKPEYAEAAY